MSREPIVWRGNLRDDCTADWNGLMLRAEMMGQGVWWWAVYGPDRRAAEIDASWNHPPTRTGKAARQSAEASARSFVASAAAGPTGRDR